MVKPNFPPVDFPPSGNWSLLPRPTTSTSISEESDATPPVVVSMSESESDSLLGLVSMVFLLTSLLSWKSSSMDKEWVRVCLRKSQFLRKTLEQVVHS